MHNCLYIQDIYSKILVVIYDIKPKMAHKTIDLYEFTTGFYMVEFKKNSIQFLSFFLPLHSHIFVQKCRYNPVLSRLGFLY